MAYDVYGITTSAPKKCGLAKFSSNLMKGLKQRFTGEIVSTMIYAIDDSHGRREYDLPVEGVIDQYNKYSWQREAGHILTKSAERRPNKPIVIMQHEFGLDGENAMGNNYAYFTGILNQAEIPVFTYLHTVLRNPNEHQKRVIQDLDKESERLIVPSQTAIKILRKSYGINPERVKHIDHGTRMHTDLSRREIKSKYGLEDMFIISHPGLKSPNKGIVECIEGHGIYVNRLPEENRKRTLSLYLGGFHEGFKKLEDGKAHERYVAAIEEKLKKYGLEYCNIESLESLKGLARRMDVIFMDRFLAEEELIDGYGVSDIIPLSYREPNQISSGILADAIGAGRVAITTKFTYANEMINDNVGAKIKEGMIIGKRGILIDLKEPVDKYGLYTPSITQMVKGLEYLTYNKEERMKMEENSFERGYPMNWPDVAGQLIQLIKLHEKMREN